MKKLLLVLLLPCLVLGAARTWNSSGSTDLNDGANYTGSGALLAADDLTFDNTSVVNAAATANLAVNSVTIASNYTGTWALTGFTATFGNGFSDDGTTGAHNYGSNITCNGASGTFHVGSGVGAITANSTILTMNTVTAGVIDDDKGLTWKQYAQGTGAVVTVSSGATSIFQNTSGPGATWDGGSLTINRTMRISRTNAGYIYTGTQPTIDGNSVLDIRVGGNVTDSVGSLTVGGTVSLTLGENGTRTGSKIVQMGNIVGNAISIQTNGASSHTYDANGYNITCGVLTLGGNNASAVNAFYAGEGTYTISGLAGVNSGTSQMFWESANFNVSGNLTLYSTWTVDPGTSLITLNGSGAQTITNANKSFYDLTVNNTGTAFVNRADSLTCHDLTLTDGPWNSATYGIYCDDLIHASTDSVRYQNVWLTGDYTRAAGATKSDTAGQHLRFLAGTTHTAALAGKTYGQITLNAATALNGGATIRALSYGVDGIKGTVESGTTLTLNSFSGGGTTLAPDTLRSGTPGIAATIAFAGTYKDTIDSAIVIADMTLSVGDTVYVPKGTDGGGNLGGWIFPSPGSTLVSKQHRLRRQNNMSIGVDIKQ